MSWTVFLENNCILPLWFSLNMMYDFSFPGWSEASPSLGSCRFTRNFSPSGTLGQYWIVWCCSWEICSVWTFGPAAGARSVIHFSLCLMGLVHCVSTCYVICLSGYWWALVPVAVLPCITVQGPNEVRNRYAHWHFLGYCFLNVQIYQVHWYLYH